MASLAPFVGRQAELRDLNLLLSKKTASLVVVRGRRRIGKSRLIEMFAKPHKFYKFTGLHPTPQTTAQLQRDHFATQLAMMSHLPDVKADDWSKLFALLANECKQGRVIILLDEISWMGSKDPNFLGKLKIAWDDHFKQNPELIMILCGSVSTWIEKNILSSTEFLGRVSLPMRLQELPLTDCNALLNQLGSHASNYEKFKMLSVTGGVPRYLEELPLELTAEESIKHLCFRPNGILFKEFEKIFSDIFGKKSEKYVQMLMILSNGSADLNKITGTLEKSTGGHISESLEDLIMAGFVSRDYTWNLKSHTEARLSQYRISDNYVRFYLKYIEKNKSKIERGLFDERPLTSLPGWNSIMGLQFENLVLNNRNLIIKLLNIPLSDIVIDNPFFQRKTARQPGCQIDYMIQTRFNTLYCCEIKFSRQIIGPQIISEMKDILDRLKTPKSYTAVPILIHVNGVDDKVYDSNYFVKIINFSDFLQPK